jgi:UDP-GlcNAc3NAcA epimerase
MITHVVGTRPNFIKCRELVRQIKVEQQVLNVSQHVGDMSEPFRPTCKTITMDHSNLVGDMILWVCKKVSPGDVIVVYGDCRASMAGALAAHELFLPLVHVESGLRCGNLRMYEERTRLAIDAMSDVNFCPSVRELKNVSKGVVTGDIMYDTFLRTKDKIDPNGYTQYVFLTLHRRELIYQKDKFLGVLNKVIERFPGREIVWPVHPHTMKLFTTYTGDRHLRSVTMLGPANHIQALSYIKHADYVVTDSGGVSKEACWFGKKVFVVRDSSEWGIPVIGEDAHGIDGEPEVHKLDSGDGTAGEKMAKKLEELRG